MLVRISGGKSSTVTFDVMSDQSTHQVPIGNYLRITNSIRRRLRSIAWLMWRRALINQGSKIGGLLARHRRLADHVNIRVSFNDQVRSNYTQARKFGLFRSV